MDSQLPAKTTADHLYDAFSIPAQAFPPLAVITRLIDVYWTKTYNTRMERCVRELYAQYQLLDESIAGKFTDFMGSEEGETLLIMAMEAMVKTHKAEKVKAIATALTTVSTAGLNYDSKEYLIKIATELEPFDVVILHRIKENELSSIESYEDLYSAIIKENERTKDEFVNTVQKLIQQSLIRVSSMLDGFDDVYSMEVLVTSGGDEDTRPKVLVTPLGKDLLNYLRMEADQP